MGGSEHYLELGFITFLMITRIYSVHEEPLSSVGGTEPVFQQHRSHTAIFFQKLPSTWEGENTVLKCSVCGFLGGCRAYASQKEA